MKYKERLAAINVGITKGPELSVIISFIVWLLIIVNCYTTMLGPLTGAPECDDEAGKWKEIEKSVERAPQVAGALRGGEVCYDWAEHMQLVHEAKVSA